MAAQVQPWIRLAVVVVYGIAAVSPLPGGAMLVTGAIMLGWNVDEMLILKTGGFTWPLYFAVGLAMALLGGTAVKVKPASVFRP